MNKKRLFEYLKSKDSSMLLELLNLAYDAIDTNQRHDVFGKIILDIPPSPVNGKKLWTTIETFHKKSISGYYYASFDINSKNYSDIPEETDAWFDEIGDYLEACSSLTDQGDHEMAVQFKGTAAAHMHRISHFVKGKNHVLPLERGARPSIYTMI